MNDQLASMAAEAMRTHEAKEERRKLRSWAHYAFGAGCALALFIAAFNAIADEIFRSKDHQGQDAVLRIKNEPCANKKVIDKLQADFLDYRLFKASVLTWKGKDFASCWVEKNGHVLSVDEDGSPFQPVPRRVFKNESI